MPIGAGLPEAIRALPKRKAVLLIGPPMSNATMAPRMRPSTTTLPPSRLERKSVIVENTQLIGWPRASTKAPPTMTVVSTGMTRVGMIGLMKRCTGIFLIPRATKPTRNPVTMPPMKPAPDSEL